MKTTILTIAIALSTVFGISQSAKAATGTKAEVSTVLTDVSKISQIEVHGNVELYLSDGTADQVKVYNSYYAESALVQNENGILRISSYSAQKLIVWVTASELSKLEVYDNSDVKSFGKLSAIELDVKLYDKASAQLDIDAVSANITLYNHAKADLSGTADQASLQTDRSSFLNTTNLTASNLVKTINPNRFHHRDAPELASL
ncbi:MAG: GIN domain-containing protein [Sphingobacteriales bacterium]